MTRSDTYKKGDAEIIRAGLLDTSNALVPGTMTETAHDALLALDRLKTELAEANTRLHSLRWLLGLDTHKGEDAQPRDESHRNLDVLLDQR